MTEIKKCKCKHKYQDKTYGKGQRVFNFRDEKKIWTCTVCGREVN